MNYIHRMTLYLVALFMAFVALLTSPEAKLTLPLCLSMVAILAGLSMEYLMAPENDPEL
uniref:hypothetical protein n=1 Tax=Thaumasiovibrio occultus TaxID=1891184 RepID=UPI00131C88E8|nr:hypothetical protein [Thaumasiovibrio occultus]